MVTVVTANNLLQLLTPPQLRGRVMSIHGMALNGLAPLGSLAAGAMAGLSSAPMTIGIMALLGFAASAAAISRLYCASLYFVKCAGGFLDAGGIKEISRGSSEERATTPGPMK